LFVLDTFLFTLLSVSCFLSQRLTAKIDGVPWSVVVVTIWRPFFLPSFRAYRLAVTIDGGQIWGPFFYPCIRGPLSQSQFFWGVCLWWDAMALFPSPFIPSLHPQK